MENINEKYFIMVCDFEKADLSSCNNLVNSVKVLSTRFDNQLSLTSQS